MPKYFLKSAKIKNFLLLHFCHFKKINFRECVRLTKYSSFLISKIFLSQTAKFEANNLTKDQEYHRELSEREDELDNLQGELEITNSELTELRKELASARSELKLRAQKIEQQVVEQRELCSQYQERLSAVEQQSMQEVKGTVTAGVFLGFLPEFRFF